MLEQAPGWCTTYGQAFVTLSPDPTATEAAKLLQLQLKSLGYEPGPIDGDIGPNTYAAINQYQRAAGLPVGRTITKELLDRLWADVDTRRAAWASQNKSNDPNATTPKTADAARAAARLGAPLLSHLGPELKGLGLLIVAGALGLWGLLRNRSKRPPPP